VEHIYERWHTPDNNVRVWCVFSVGVKLLWARVSLRSVDTSYPHMYNMAVSSNGVMPSALNTISTTSGLKTCWACAIACDQVRALRFSNLKYFIFDGNSNLNFAKLIYSTLIHYRYRRVKHSFTIRTHRCVCYRLCSLHRRRTPIQRELMQQINGMTASIELKSRISDQTCDLHQLRQTLSVSVQI
jgi:hypothetical protein